MTRKTRTVYGIGLNTGDAFYGNTYIASIYMVGEFRFADIATKGIINTRRIRLDDEQLYTVAKDFHAPYQRYIMGRVIEVQTTGHTAYGNPIKRVAIENMGGRITWFRISDNASLVYGIENDEYNCIHYFELTKANRLSGRTKIY